MPMQEQRKITDGGGKERVALRLGVERPFDKFDGIAKCGNRGNLGGGELHIEGYLQFFDQGHMRERIPTIAFCKGLKQELPLQYVNFRD